MTRCPFATWKPITANLTRGGRQPIRGFVPHVQVGTGSLWAFFNTHKPPGSGASADFWCSTTGDLEEYVDLTDQSWAQGSRQHNGNPTFVSCEFEGFPHEPMTPAQIAKGGQLIAWLRSDVNDFPLQLNHDPDNGYGITPHYVFGGGHTCPGPGPRESQFADLIAAAQPSPTPTPPEDDDMNGRAIIFSQNHKWVFRRGDDGRIWYSIDGGPGGNAIDGSSIASSPSATESGGVLIVGGKGVSDDRFWAARRNAATGKWTWGAEDQ